MTFFGILIVIGIIGLLFSGIGGGFWHRRRYGSFRPFGYSRHRRPPMPPRGPGRIHGYHSGHGTVHGPSHAGPHHGGPGMGGPHGGHGGHHGGPGGHR